MNVRTILFSGLLCLHYENINLIIQLIKSVLKKKVLKVTFSSSFQVNII